MATDFINRSNRFPVLAMSPGTPGKNVISFIVEI